MPQIIMQINRTQKSRFNEYLSQEFSQTHFAKNDAQFAVIETSKYPEYIFLQSSNPHNLCLALWNDKVLNKYMHQTYLIKWVTTDLNFIAHHNSLLGEHKIFKLFGDKRVINVLGPMIPLQIELSPSEKKCTHILNVIKAYDKYYVGIFDKQHCFGSIATNIKLHYGEFADSSVSRAYFKLREIFLREAAYFKDRRISVALDIGAAPGGWTKYLVDNGAKHVMSVDPGLLNLDAATMQCVTYYSKAIEKCVADGDLAAFTEKHGKFDSIVCDANIEPTEAVGLINQLFPFLADHGYIVFTMKMRDRKKERKAASIEYCINALRASFENVKLRFLLANKPKERTLIATKLSRDSRDDETYTFHEIHSF